MRTITEGDLDRALLLLPSPLFRQRDVFDVAEDLGFKRWVGQSLWFALTKRGWIVRSGVPLDRSHRKFYWQRTPGAR